MLRLLIGLLMAAQVAVLPTTAQHMNEKNSPCAEIAMTADLVGCLAKARDAAEADLNSAYENLRGELRPADVQLLIAAQRHLYAGGTAGPPAHLASLEALTRARTRELAVTYAVALK